MTGAGSLSLPKQWRLSVRVNSRSGSIDTGQLLPGIPAPKRSTFADRAVPGNLAAKRGFLSQGAINQERTQ
jgi:hypothetical protein